jgi:hypothetical protein
LKIAKSETGTAKKCGFGVILEVCQFNSPEHFGGVSRAK